MIVNYIAYSLVYRVYFNTKILLYGDKFHLQNKMKAILLTKIRQTFYKNILPVYNTP